MLSSSCFLVLGSWFLFFVLAYSCLDPHMCFLNTHTLPGFPQRPCEPQLKPSYGICRDTTTTVGAHHGASCGVGWSFHRTGSSASECVLSGLVFKIGEFSFVSDNAGCFSGKPFPVEGFLMMLGSFITYVTTEHVNRYPTQVIEAEDPPAFRA